MGLEVRQQILDDITKFYLESPDFNGLPVSELRSQHDLDVDELDAQLRALIGEGLIGLVFGDVHPNPHIRALPGEPVDSQLQKLESSLREYACAYPSKKHLVTVVDPTDYGDRPYKSELALGEPSLAIKNFELSILEFYKNDPRYWYTTNDISGWISARSSSLAEREQIYLQTFGFSYDNYKDLNRAVAVPIHYLLNLTPEHQQMWKTKELSGDYSLHPDYARQIWGQWPERISIFDAFIEELKLINEMCDLMARRPLFRKTFEKDRPVEFTFLIRPTLSELNNFVLLLDKMMSDNIDKKFFAGELEEQIEIARGDGKIEVRQKGTITLLQEWLGKRFRPSDDPTIMENTIATFREVREIRQKPAHAVSPNEFDQKYFHDQRELMIRGYDAVRTVRLILANHPAVEAANIQINELLFKGKIWTF